VGKLGTRQDPQQLDWASGRAAFSPRAILKRPFAWLLLGAAILALQWVTHGELAPKQVRVQAIICLIAAVVEFLASLDPLLWSLGQRARSTMRAVANFALYSGAVLLVAISTHAVELLAAAWLVYVVAMSSIDSSRHSLRWIDLATLWWALGIGYVVSVHASVAMALPWIGLLCTAIKLRLDNASQPVAASATIGPTASGNTTSPEDDAYPSWVQHDSTLHDLSNAMTASLFMVRDLTRALEKGSEPNLRRALRLSQELASELSQMSDHINTSRQSARWQPIAGSPVSIIDPVRRGVEHVSLLYPDVACRIQCELSEEQARINVVGGAATLRRIVENLMINSCQALADSPDKQVLCAIELVGSTVTLTVSDNGPGFPRVILDLHPSPLVSTKSGGSGIGLYSCHQLVKRDGGKLRIANRETGGARVTIAWPQAAVSLGPSPNLSDVKIRSSGTRTRPNDEQLESQVADK
jgi:signal transduction histidine kinase